MPIEGPTAADHLNVFGGGRSGTTPPPPPRAGDTQMASIAGPLEVGSSLKMFKVLSWKMILDGFGG